MAGERGGHGGQARAQAQHEIDPAGGVLQVALHRFPQLPLRVLQHLPDLLVGKAKATQQANAVPRRPQRH